MSTADIITAIAGSSGVLAAIGAAGKFVWNKVDMRFAHIESELQECRKRESESQERRSIQITVIELLWLKVKEMDPTAPVLERAERLLDKLKQASNSE